MEGLVKLLLLETPRFGGKILWVVIRSLLCRERPQYSGRWQMMKCTVIAILVHRRSPCFLASQEKGKYISQLMQVRRKENTLSQLLTILNYSNSFLCALRHTPAYVMARQRERKHFYKTKPIVTYN